MSSEGRGLVGEPRAQHVGFRCRAVQCARRNGGGRICRDGVDRVRDHTDVQFDAGLSGHLARGPLPRSMTYDTATNIILFGGTVPPVVSRRRIVVERHDLDATVPRHLASGTAWGPYVDAVTGTSSSSGVPVPPGRISATHRRRTARPGPSCRLRPRLPTLCRVHGLRRGDQSRHPLRGYSSTDRSRRHMVVERHDLDPVRLPQRRRTLAYVHGLDAATGTIILFGGGGFNGFFGDTWSWNGTTWTEKATGAPPQQRCIHRR